MNFNILISSIRFSSQEQETTRGSGVQRVQHVSCNEMRTRACASVSKVLFIGMICACTLGRKIDLTNISRGVGCFSVNPLIFRPATFVKSTVIINCTIDRRLSRICIEIKYCFDYFDGDTCEQANFILFAIFNLELSKCLQNF